ncbi:putative glutamate carboxypeptidase AMP1 [Abeliophyllum distichum]|uniref:Glutamate carboxypeptidase AMP1 n=1 Tax=Abeliophyllum distichum TaxID=126358 RepID=A0ABD1P489_9LAMI
MYYKNTFLSSASKYTVAAYLVGTPAAIHTVLYIKAQFEAHGLDARFANYSTLLSYLKHSSLSAQFSNGTTIYLPLSEPNVPLINMRAIRSGKILGSSLATTN